MNRTYSKPPYERLMIKLKQVQACCDASLPCVWLMTMTLRVADDDDVAGQHVRAAGAADQHVSASGCRALHVTLAAGCATSFRRTTRALQTCRRWSKASWCSTSMRAIQLYVYLSVHDAACDA